jgi:hypothetical protein
MDASMFEPVEEIARLGPSHFPKPTHLYHDHDSVVPVARPIIGEHRPNVHAVFAYAEGYALDHYILFLQTLRETGFDGDVVLAISDDPHDDIVEFLSFHKHVVVYKASLDCFDQDRITRAPRRRIKNQATDVFQMCQLKNIYANSTTTQQDARAGRVVATLRYEWYWIWSLQYQPQQWILLLDARDSMFQLDPFPDTLPVTNQSTLYFFGENSNATRLGNSRKNANWLRNAYGMVVLQALKNKPTLCSGSTMGNQRAIETYLRAMVNEWDETDIGMTGADQGFHNYLYYSHKLAGAIDTLVVWEQGKSIVNNLGALRTSSLTEWGIYNETTHQVFNWDGSLSPVAHQWDRDQHLFRYTTQQRMPQMVKTWSQQKRQAQIILT